MIFTPFRSEMGYRFCVVGLEWDIVFEGIRECMNVLLIYCVVLNPNEFFKKLYTNSKWILRKLFVSNIIYVNIFRGQV